MTQREQTMRRFRYTIHNIIGHPLMEIFYLLGLSALAERIHDITLPKGMK
jgi:hypothetical protein